MLNKDTIQQILNKPYNRESWIDFLRQILGGSYRLNAPQIALPANDITSEAFEIGQFETADNMLVGVYEVKIKNGVSIENKRVGLRQLLRSVYRVVDAALIVFDTGEVWRFSYVSEIFTRDEAGNRQQLKTDPKRYTYLLGKGGGVRTATDRFEGLSKKYQSIKLKDLTDAFSVEILTKDFYRELSDWYFWAITKVKFPDDIESNEEVRNATATIRLITRLMFVWFLKQKSLVPDELFDENELRKILKNFNPSVSSLPVFSSEQNSTYYKAILQNLFFATLNTEMSDDKRRFINRQTGVQGFYRYERYFQDKELFLELTRNVPFLNGGLFENLDRNVGEANEIRIDCFSNKLSNESRLSVPDELFFGKETVDLSGVYDDKKRKPAEIKGIIQILKSYNFTVEENTPTDIEVALDPELLGKVFENLLASYNPETKTTARKQTGSFYTPREIVEYMVDESLKAYLKEKLGANLIENQGEEQLNTLFSYATEENPFDEAQTQLLIKAIDECRILDPACGSGAFPMGVLQRLVFLLRKLDPKNQYWKERQIKRATKEFEEALRNGQTVDIQARVQEITETFQNNTDDYGRKLFLIENSIFGVDIQPIAVQIAKLRFFISLMAEQKAPVQSEVRSLSVAEVNRGIRPLPNLETKFVAANTLIGLEKGKGIIIPPKVQDLEEALEKVRHRHFFARTPETKKKYREKDIELRTQISELLKTSGFPTTAANQVAAWNPYDQNAYAPFFDPEWMFGITDGFDIVIGNPPYGAELKDKKIYKKLFPETSIGNIDSYKYFIDKGLNLSNKKGILTFITSDSYLEKEYFKDLRELILKRSSVIKNIKLGDDIFDNVTIPTAILQCVSAPPNKAKVFNSDVSLFNLHDKLKKIFFSETLVSNNPNLAFFTSETLINDKNCEPLINLYEQVMGVKVYQIGKGKPRQTSFEIENDIFLSTVPKDENWIKFIDSGVKKYYYEVSEKYIYYGEWLAEPREIKYFENEKLIVREVVNPVVYACYYSEKAIVKNTNAVIIQKHKDFSLKFLCAIINSNLFNYYIIKKSPKSTNKLFPSISSNLIKNFPVKKILPNSQTPFIRLVDYILHLKKQQNADAELMANYFEQIIDGLVYELYFEQELHTAGVYFHQHLQDLPAGLESIEHTFARLYDPKHPVRQGLFKLSSIEEVAIIEGKQR